LHDVRSNDVRIENSLVYARNLPATCRQRRQASNERIELSLGRVGRITDDAESCYFLP
jgi:hypothetical protein